MGYLIEKSKLRNLVTGDGLAEIFIKNSTSLYYEYQKSSDDVMSMSVKKMFPGAFYHITSENESNWMRNSPIFLVDFKKVLTNTILLAVNLNLIPLEVRVLFFDKFISERDFEKNNYLRVSYTKVYEELRSIGFEYALMEFDASKILMCHKISMNKLPTFLLSAHPTNKYDPMKLFSIWKVKLEKSAARDAEMQKANLEDFYDVKKTLDGKYEALKGHIQRIRRNL
jgi:hypothetical protein